MKGLCRISNKHLNCSLLYSSLKLFSAFLNYKSYIHGDEKHLFELFLTDQISELTEVDIVSDMLLSDFAVYNKWQPPVTPVILQCSPQQTHTGKDNPACCNIAFNDLFVCVLLSPAFFQVNNMWWFVELLISFCFWKGNLPLTSLFVWRTHHGLHNIVWKNCLDFNQLGDPGMSFFYWFVK